MKPYEIGLAVLRAHVTTEMWEVVKHLGYCSFRSQVLSERNAIHYIARARVTPASVRDQWRKCEELVEDELKREKERKWEVA